MTELEEMFKTQINFQRKIFPEFDTLSEEEKRNLTKEMTLHLLTEIDELLSNVGEWKTHKIKEVSIRKSGITEEIVDMQKFLVNIALIWGVTPDEFIQKFHEKTVINEQKFLWERKLIELKDKKVVIFDIDGTLNEYPAKCVAWVNEKLKSNFNNAEYLKLGNKIEYDRYEKLKNEFRETQLKNISLNENVKTIFERLKDAGISIILLTARPIKHKETFNTIVLTFVEKNVPFDVLITDSEKAIRIAKDLKNVLFFVDDEPQFINEVSKLGITCYLMNAPYNDSYSCGEKITRVFSLEEILDREKIGGEKCITKLIL